MSEKTFVDLFAGIGMARMGMEQAGFECVYTCEFDKHKRKEYEIIHGNIPEGCDIRDVRAADIPRADVWFFGAPCQDFSIAGLRKGLLGDRSSLIGEVFRLLKEKAEDKPEWIIYENVKGMLSSNGGWDFFSIISEMDELGYDVEWQVLNTKISDCLRIGKECTLSDILENVVASKYYLSQRTVDKLISWESKSIQTLSPQDMETHCQTERTSLKVMNVNKRA